MFEFHYGLVESQVASLTIVGVETIMLDSVWLFEADSTTQGLLKGFAQSWRPILKYNTCKEVKNNRVFSACG